MSKQRKGAAAQRMTGDLLHALDAAKAGDIDAALPAVGRLRSPSTCEPICIPPARLPELARLWGASARREDRTRVEGEPVAGDPWDWESRACDSWLDFLAAAEGVLPLSDGALVEMCAAAHREGYFRVAAPRVVPVASASQPTRRRRVLRRELVFSTPDE